MIARCFSPIIPVLIGCGMIKSVLAILTTLNLITTTSGEYQILNMIGDLLFYFFPFFLAVSAAKKFKTHEFLAIALAGTLMYPTIQNGAMAVAESGITSLSFLGLSAIFVNYKSTIILIIIAVWVMSYVHKWVNKIIPDTFKVLFVPMFVLFIMVPLELIVIGPFGAYVGKGIAQIVTWLYEINIENKAGCMLVAGDYYAYSCHPEDVFLALQKNRESYFFIDIQAIGEYPKYSQRLFEEKIPLLKLNRKI